MQTVQELVTAELWEEFYVDVKSKEIIPKTAETTELYQQGKVNWSSVSQVKK